MTLALCLVALMFGGLVGAGVMSICRASGNADRHMGIK